VLGAALLATTWHLSRAAAPAPALRPALTPQGISHTPDPTPKGRGE
jgi:hypothetical protein